LHRDGDEGRRGLGEPWDGGWLRSGRRRPAGTRLVRGSSSHLARSGPVAPGLRHEYRARARPFHGGPSAEAVFSLVKEPKVIL
jgi:hypothetical protein